MAETDAYRYEGSGIPVQAQPLPPSHYSANPTYAQAGVYAPYAYPSTAQQQHQQGLPLTGGSIQSHQDHIPNRPPPRGYWGSNICDFPMNLFPSCYCACCCMHGCWIVGQMAEKTGFSLFRTVTAGYVLMWIITIAIMFTSLANTGVWLPPIFMMLVNIGLRLHIVRTRQITECGSPADGCGNLTGECCCGFWCGPCAIAQEARYLYGYTKTFDGDSRIDRPDQYAEVPVQTV